MRPVPGRSTVVIELAGDAVSRDLAAGGVFVPGCTLRMAEECDLVVCGADRQVSVPARVVYVDQRRGAGLELIGFSTAMRAQIAELTRARGVGSVGSIDDDLAVPLAAGSSDNPSRAPTTTQSDFAPASLESEPAGDDDALTDWLDDDLEVPLAFGGGDDQRTGPATRTDSAAWEDDRSWTGRDLAPDPALAGTEPAATLPTGGDATDSEAAPLGAILDDGAVEAADERDTGPVEVSAASDEASAVDAAEDDPAEHADAGDPLGDDVDDPVPGAAARRHGAEARGTRSVHERLRGLTLVSQLKLAAAGEQHERIVLERLYGKNVWETLLRNPRLTAPEVARIARYGALPRVLLEIILANNAWLQVPEVRRALLTNPRLGTDQIMKVLRLVPKHELKLAAVQTAYPYAVRNTAKMLMRGE